MKILITAISRNYDDDEYLKSEIDKNPCNLCLLGQGPMCVDRSKCRWETDREIYVKESVSEDKSCPLEEMPKEKP